MNLLSVLLWILAGCALFVLLALFVGKALAWFFGKMEAREQKYIEEGRVSRWTFPLAFLVLLNFVYQATTFFDSWVIKLAIFIPGTLAAVVGSRVFTQSLRKQRLEEQRLKLEEKG